MARNLDIHQIPDGWSYGLLDNYAIRCSGHTPSKSFPEYWNGGIKWVSLTDSFRLDKGLINKTDKEISLLGIENSSAQIHPAGTVVMSRDAGVGKSAIMAKPMAVSQHFIAWKCDSNKKTHNWYLYNLGHENAADDHFGRFRRGVPPKTKGDYAFISHMIETLKPASGRMGVVVPHGVLFRASSEGKIRKQLIEENLLDTVIGLPEKLFFGTGIPAAILLFKKQKSDSKVLFIDASREFKSGKNQNVLTTENIHKIVDTYKARETTDKYSYLATMKEISENDYNLNIPRYVDTFEEEAEIDLMAVRGQRLALQTELAELETEMAGYLEELGYE